MTPRTPNSRLHSSLSSSKLLAPLIACMATLLGLPVHAGITLPDTPMQTNSGAPPNIWFILDDSGSMAWRYMYNPSISSLVRDGGNVVADATGDNRTKDSDYGSNSTALDAMYDQNYITNTIYYNPNQTYRGWQSADGTYMANDSYDSVSTSNTHLTGTSNLNGAVQTFYMPPTSGALNDARLYTRYTFLTNGTAQRCTWNATNRNFSTTANCTNVTSFTWPNGVTRNVTQEKANFANWYTYHRTRTKVAKAGVSYAFNDTSIFNEDSAYRVGFTTIWQRDEYRIPVATDNGLFRNDNRNEWFDRMFDATASNGTPLKAALIRAGQYFEESGTGGPWGPQATARQFECRQNFTILTTDGFWNSDTTAPVATMGNSDGTAGALITGVAPPERPLDPPPTYTYPGGAPFSDAWSNTLADVAMHYWKRDLRTDLPNTVSSSASNPAFWQHMVTFGISIGLRGTLNVENTLDSVRNNTAVAWPNPNDNEDAERIDDLFHAAVNGRGAFVSAGNPDQFVDGLGGALRSIASRRATGSNASVAGSSTTAGVKVFIARYFSGKWYGELSAYPVTNAGVGSAAIWNTSFPAWNTRRIFTHNGTAGAVFPTTAQQTALTAPIVDYLKGDRSREQIINAGGTLRNRQSLLGDIVNSSPVFVKSAPGVETVYVGANDGMLHAFNAVTGAERFAYVPNGQDFASLKLYADPDYNHKFYVDGPVVVSSEEHSKTQTTLVGALGRGGRGLYALDITNPTSFDQTKVLWEKTGANEANLGQVLGAPFIARLNNGSLAIIVSNGINSASDKAVLFIFDLRTGAKIREIEVPASGSGPNGLSAPNGWNEDGDSGDTIEYVYAGDLRGNVWKFDLSSSSPSSWGVADNRPLYAPTSGVAQPITGGVTISYDPVTEKRWVFFGTGRLLTTTDLLDDSLQTWYGIQDSNNTSSLTRSNLTSRNIAIYDEATKRRAFEPSAPLPANSKGWYIDLDLPPSNTREGERMIGEPQVLRDVLIASSVIPNTTNPCQPGRGYLNAIDAYTGTSVRAGFFDANFDGKFNDTLGGGVGTGTFIGSIDPNVGLLTDPVCVDGQCIVNGALGPASVPVPQEYFSGRISWREIVRN